MSSLELSGVDYVAMLHDKDYKDDGELAKAHYHYVVVFSSAKTLSAGQKWFAKHGIEDRFVRIAEDKKHDIRYLCHADNPEKYQYDPELAKGTLKSALLSYMEVKQSEEQSVLAILDIIDKQKKCSYRELVRVCCKAELWSALRRMGTWGVKCLEEHNDEYFSKNYLGNPSVYND